MKGKIIVPYSKQEVLVNRLLNDQDACATVDAIQGTEYDDVIADFARNHGTGFTRDPRRTNVMFSRARDSLIIALSKSIGYHSRPGAGHDYFFHIRQTCMRMGVVFDAGDLSNPEETTRLVLKRMRDSPPLERAAVEKAFEASGEFFAGYMQAVAGTFVEATPIPESDSEEECEEKAAEVLLERPCHSEGYISDGDLPDVPVDGVDMLPAVVVNALTRRMETAARMCNTFLPCHITNIEKCLLAASTVSGIFSRS